MLAINFLHCTPIKNPPYYSRTCYNLLIFLSVYTYVCLYNWRKLSTVTQSRYVLLCPAIEVISSRQSRIYLYCSRGREGVRPELALGLISIARESSLLCTHTLRGYNSPSSSPQQMQLQLQLRNKFPAYIDTDFISFNASPGWLKAHTVLTDRQYSRNEQTDTQAAP